MSQPKHLFPDFLTDRVEPEDYASWLKRKAAAHVKRDLKRSFSGVSGENYRDAIHAAVVRSEGLDVYTGEDLDWGRIGEYDNEKSKAGRHAYKASLALLPTVDHVDASSTSAQFLICAWRTNDAKNDLSLDAFVDLCAKVLRKAGYRVEKKL